MIKISRIGWIALILAFTPVNETITIAAAETNTLNLTELFQQGVSSYQAGEYQQSIAIWQEMFDTAAAKGDILNSAIALSNLALAYQQMGHSDLAEAKIALSLELLANNPEVGTEADRNRVLAQIYNNRGHLQLAASQPQAAVESFKLAKTYSDKINDETGVIRATINQAKALGQLGFYRRADRLLREIQPRWEKQPDSSLKAAGLRQFGNLLLTIGDLDRAESLLTQSLEVATAIDSPPQIATSLFGLGNLAVRKQEYNQAISYYQRSQKLTSDPPLKIRAKLNQLRILLIENDNAAAYSLIEQLQSDISRVPPSRIGVYSRIDLAKILIDKTSLQLNPSELVDLLTTATKVAQQLKDRRGESYSLGYLGRLYLQQGNYSQAEQLTEAALLLSGQINASDISYLWQWQLGRLSRQQGKKEQAITSYRAAVENLRSIRTDLVATNPDIQFEFRDEVEPVYRELVDLLLQPSATKPVSQANLIQARDTIEALQIAELENFFREACIRAKEDLDRIIDQTSPQTAVIYPIILGDRLEILVKLPQQPLQHYTTAVARAEVEATLVQLRQDITKPYTLRQVQAKSQQIYSWLIQPLAFQLQTNQINTLVFVLDGALRNVPMGILHDGEKYLIQDYSIAVTPGLQLVDTQPWSQTEISALTAGLSQSRHGFASLKYVNQELEKIQAIVNQSRVITNEEFTANNLENQIEEFPYSIVHIATHGQFSSEAENTFILAWDQPISVNQLNRLLRNRDNTTAIELLVLSACETATGDNRAALGLAGVSIRAGARSTVASLWNLDDQSSAVLIGAFYQNLTQNNISKAEALRQAQISLLGNPRYQHPRYWGAYVLVGSWL